MSLASCRVVVVGNSRRGTRLQNIRDGCLFFFFLRALLLHVVQECSTTCGRIVWTSLFASHKRNQTAAKQNHRNANESSILFSISPQWPNLYKSPRIIISLLVLIMIRTIHPRFLPPKLKRERDDRFASEQVVVYNYIYLAEYTQTKRSQTWYAEREVRRIQRDNEDTVDWMLL